jgi:DNA-binding GntR family transcriptional regulator
MDILVGKYKQRERLLESDIMEKYGITRNAVRKIFKNIEIKGLVTHILNRGIHVTEVDAKDAKDLYSIRVLLENYAMELVFKNISFSDLDDLIKVNNQFQKAVENKDFNEMVKINNRFHQSIIDISGNIILVEMINQIRNRVTAIRHYVWFYPEYIQRSVEDHNALIEALRGKDIIKIKNINEPHILAAFEIYTKMKYSNFV